MPTAAAAAVVAALLACAGALLLAQRARVALRLERLAARLARERAAAFVEGVRRLGVAALRSSADVRDEIDAAVRRLAPAVDCVLLFDDDGTDLQCSFASGARVGYFLGARIARGDLTRLPALAVREARRVTPADGARSFHPADAFAVAIPLPGNAGRTNVLYAAAPAAVDAAALEAIVTLADQAAFTYALAQEREADRRRAEFDALTGLLTPRAFRERLGLLLERARTAPLARLAVLFVDTDRFKAWNDTYGHASGDALLRAIARTLQGAVDAGELAARNGGDEFCVVFVDTEKSTAIERAERLRAAVADLDFATLRDGAGTDGAEPVRVTASIGVAAYPADATGANDLLERADAAMYHAKRTGRDGVAYHAPGGEIVRASVSTLAAP
jgi:diguanylate cyclase (GGDEF)-like protein